ncbi:uncharacterized protein LOC121981997 [Zingiber officinale]|uniref:Uncharacterized protein n=1 Tax=Zingiber officinale TaxID=94328 RepID=A0A8J5GIZ8_ZINOF|nr:uncharacterized protein LOC121981997 [Zingiber officinale]KAG6508616.1 hypothetical protein ZIOFF_033995 [Zingiber officinale]
MEGDGEAPLVPYRCGERDLDAALRRLEVLLSSLGFPTSSSLGLFAASCVAFLFLGVAVPTAAILLSRCSRSGCEEYEVQQFDLCVTVSETSLAAVSLVTISRNLLKYGMRKFLFVDQHHGYVVRLQEKYISKIQDFFHLLLWWILPCSLVKIAREIVRCMFILHESTWRAVVVFLASILSWLYLTAVLLSATLLFNLVCNLQIIHFEDYGKVFERDVDPVTHLEEHTRLRFYLSKISHRFRIFLLLLFLFVTSSQFVTLFQTTGYSGNINFANAGDIAVSSVVQVVVVILCLNAASKISHRAQGIASLASRWHAYITCSPTGSQMQNTNSAGNVEVIPESSSVMDNSESDLESFEDMLMQNTSQFTSSMFSFQRRQALVTYLQSNPGGITIFGWTVDRVLLNTIFFLELSLILFVLGKTIVFTGKN